MKKKISIFLIFIATITLVSCSSPKPDDVALDFYNYLNTGQVEKAKELASPSAKEFIDKLAGLEVFETKGDILPFELMDIKKPEAPIEGDTSIVNYKIGEFKSKISLVFNDKQWRVIFDEDLKKLRLIEITGESLYLDYLNDKEVFWENYNGCRFRVKSLLYFDYPISPSGISFNKEKMTVLLPGKALVESLDYVSFCGNKLERKGMENETEISSPGMYAFNLREFTSKKQKKKQMKKLISVKHNSPYPTKWDFKCSFDFEGVFVDYSYGLLDFIDCQVDVTSDCNSLKENNSKKEEVEVAEENTSSIDNTVNSTNTLYYMIEDPDGYTNMRKSADGDIIRKVYPNEKFEVVGTDGKYKKVKFSNSEVGFIHESRVVTYSETEEETPEEETTE